MNLRWTLLALLLAFGARAEDKKPDERPVRVRASHQVDVIAPGEKVETVLDRMHAAHPPPPSDGKPAGGDRPPVRGPGAGPGGPGAGPPHGGGTRPGPSTGPPASGPPPDRHH